MRKISMFQLVSLAVKVFFKWSIYKHQLNRTAVQYIFVIACNSFPM